MGLLIGGAQPVASAPLQPASYGDVLLEYAAVREGGAGACTFWVADGTAGDVPCWCCWAQDDVASETRKAARISVGGFMTSFSARVEEMQGGVMVVACL